MLKILFTKRYYELLEKEKVVDSENASTYEELQERKLMLIKEINSVEYRLRQIKSTYTKLSKLKK